MSRRVSTSDAVMTGCFKFILAVIIIVVGLCVGCLSGMFYR